MLKKKILAQTKLSISPIGLGAFKIGRNQKVKYPSGDGYQLISDLELENLLSQAIELGVNLIDVAPAYGSAEKRIGETLLRIKKRNHFVISTKVGEIFQAGNSVYDFSKAHIQKSIEQSLKALGGECLDLLFLHCDRNDLSTLQSSDAIETLVELKKKGLVEAIGVSTTSLEGGLFAANIDAVDALMVAFNIHYQDEIAVIKKAKANGKGVLIKKALLSGNLDDSVSAEDCLRPIFALTNADSVIVGTDKINHLEKNAAIIAKAASELVS